MAFPSIEITSPARRATPRGSFVVVQDGIGLPDPLVREARRQWRTGRHAAAVATLGLHPAVVAIALERVRGAGPLPLMKRYGAAARALVREHAHRAVVVVPDDLPPECAEPLLLGLTRGLYRFDRYRTHKEPDLPHVELRVPSAAWVRAAKRALPVAEAVWLTRDLVNTPAEDMGPAELEAVARRIARRMKMSVRVLDARRCAARGLRALHAVGRASTRPPRLVVLEYAGAPRSDEVLALAGKGVVFDTGGLDIKSAGGMELMKKDMGGAATVLGAAWVVGKLRPRRNVRFYLPIAENAISGNALRPGDVITAFDGTTVEVGNTDAEGRLILGDAVALAVDEGATRVVDAATLTGAALVALGRVRVPLVGNDDALLGAVEAAADACGERVWRFPADKEYRDQIESRVADLRNTGKAGEAGVIAGALFIGHFARQVPWAHLDISPASWADAAGDFGPAGATGTMVATLARLATG